MQVDRNHIVLSVLALVLAAAGITVALLPGAQSPLAKGKALLAKRRFAEASQEFSRVIAADKKNIEALVARADAFMDSEHVADAAIDLSNAIEIQPDNAALYVSRAKCYTKSHQFDRANADLERAIAINPQLSEAYYEKNVLAENSRLEMAMNYNSSLSKTATPEVASRRAEWFEQMHDSTGAKKALDAAIKDHPDDIQSRNSRAQLLMALKRYSEAQEDFDAMVQLRPNQAASYAARAGALAEQRRYNEAMRDLNRAITLDPCAGPIIQATDLID